ncbi:type III-B CRISPR module RAMP protein Cmr4 [Nocardiopsis lambiniae]|uniref:Type III-B CRISPR module RAMP protein Cmr4 n=1 Tax=Nocardiopsis lambiniae TaxID=3075539 RepID=A0ABU2MB43_9ACTN|nr:type III-B CRISPR module RAMP protein Cmr4 [Nocardiopsis sp. DSM 44743]MDT0329345.1 type III-B CRISPR module RAMP protein Cmr4 [Nocardiopsis sp. DSM 44743]
MDVKDLLLFFYTESPLHAGASDSEGIIDLPIQREAHTRYPTVYGQSLKGALRQAAEEHTEWTTADVHAVFGSPVGGRGGTTAGLLSVGDAQLVALPIPTLRRTFAWVTSVIALGRLSRKYRAVGLTEHPVPPAEPEGVIAIGHGWTGDQALGPLVLPVDGAVEGAAEDGRNRLVADWAARIAADAFAPEPAFAPFSRKFGEDLLLVDATAMATLVEEGTEVSVRVQLNSGKTVENGPFHSEYLPAETVLASVLTLRGRSDGAPPDPDHLRLLRSLLHGPGTVLHRLGGDETLGKGLVWTRLVDTGSGTGEGTG